MQYWDSVNAQLDPEMHEKIMNREFFDQKCDECGAVVRIMYTFLYHNMEHKLMVYMIAETDPEKQKEAIDKINELSDMVENAPTDELASLLSGMSDGYTNRIVADYNGLIEKIIIANNGFDDRLIEIIKAIVMSRLGDALKGKTLDAIYYDENAEGERALVFVFDDGKTAAIDFPADLYDELKEKLLPDLDPITPKGYAVIDYSWALGAFAEMSGT